MHADDKEVLRDLIREEVAAVGPDVHEVVRTAVHETLATMGVDASDPFEVQADFAFLREVRETSEAVKRKGILLVFGTLVAALLGALAVGLKGTFSP